MSDPCDTYRGALPHQRPDARAMERLARNPTCTRLRAIIAAGVNPATLAEQVLGISPAEGQSPLALAAGETFDRQLADNDYSAIFARFQEQGLLTATECKVRVIPDEARTSEEQVRLSRELIRQRYEDPAAAPNLMIKPRLEMPIAGIATRVEPDFAVAPDTQAGFDVGEVKSFSDYGPETPGPKLTGTLRQAAVGVLFLRYELAQIATGGHPEAEALVADRAHVILKRAGSAQPALSTMRIARELATVTSAIDELAANIIDLDALLDGGILDDPATVSALPANYESACREHCPLVPYCKVEALRESNPAVLGKPVFESLHAAGSISRAIELAHGAKARNAEEGELAALLRRMQVAYEGFRLSA
jgi:hypothetical protein